MTEHVHKWTYEYDNHGNGYFAEWWELYRDGEYMGRGISTNEDDAKDIVARLNATERLSAEDARNAAICVRLAIGWLDSGQKRMAKDCANRAEAYADTLEGK